MITELRYLGNSLIVFIAIVALMAVALGIGVSAHLGPGLTTVFFFLIGGCAFVAYTLFLMPRHGLDRAQARPPARIMPLLLDVFLIGLASFGAVSSILAIHRGERVSTDDLIIDGALVVWGVVSTIREARSRSHGQTGNALFDERRLNDLKAAYAQPTFNDYSRAIAPLRNRGFGRLALLALIPITMIVLAPIVGIGPALLIAFFGIAGIFLALHRLIDL